MNNKRKPEDRVSDNASLQTLIKAENEQVALSFFRMDAQKNQCGFGRSGLCCRLCHMGPCRITKSAPRGVCGADADTVAARNFLREVAGGAAAHSDHGRHLVLLLKQIARGEGGGYAIKDRNALVRAARHYGIEEDGKSDNGLALDLSEHLLSEFGAQEDPLETIRLAPVKRMNLWNNRNVNPGGIDRMIVESLHRTHIGVDHDPASLLLHAFRTSLADGWGGSRIASLVSDIIFGTPGPVKSTANLGVLRADTVNVVVHGHEPALSEMLAAASSDDDVLDHARRSGASGVTLAGICCTANEILMRHGIPVAGNFLQQELAIITGAVEMMIIDVQCCMPGLVETASYYHTEIVSTSRIAKTPGAHHLDFSTRDAYDNAKSLLMRAIDNFSKRDHGKVAIPDVREPLVAGFSVEAIRYMLGGTFRASFRPLNDAVIQGRIKGIAGIVGCNNPKQKLDQYINELTVELLKNDILVLKTGCAAIASAKAGMLTPEAALVHAGPGLREVCEAIGIPPVLHMGSCVDNSRLLEAATELVLEGGLGDDISDLPLVGFAPEWMSEKAVSIGCYFVASGIDVILGHPFYVTGSESVTSFLEKDASDIFGAAFHVKDNPVDAAAAALQIILKRREKLGINRTYERKLMDMKDRRELNV